MDFWEQVQDIYFRSKNIVSRGYVVGNDRSGKMPKARIKTNSGTEYADLDLVSTPGLAYHSIEGSKNEVLLFSPGGDLSHAIALQIGDRENYKKLERPGVALYHPDDPRRSIHIQDDGTIEIQNEGAKVLKMLPDGSIEIQGKVKFKEDVTFEKDIKVEGQTTLLNTTINGVTQVGN